MMLPAGTDEPERLLARGYVPAPKITGFPASLGTTALLLTVAALKGADQQLHENKRRESARVRLDRRYIFNRSGIKDMRRKDCGLI